jgi:hypothetical protein
MAAVTTTTTLSVVGPEAPCGGRRAAVGVARSQRGQAGRGAPGGCDGAAEWLCCVAIGTMGSQPAGASVAQGRICARRRR